MIRDSFPGMSEEEIELVHQELVEMTASCSQDSYFKVSLDGYRETMELRGDVPSMPKDYLSGIKAVDRGVILPKEIRQA